MLKFNKLFKVYDYVIVYAANGSITYRGFDDIFYEYLKWKMINQK